MTRIYYFSGTGNTLWSARRMAELLSAGGESVEVHNLGSAIRSLAVSSGWTLSISADTVVFLFPAYACQLPTGVSRFFQAVDIKAGYIAGCVTCGSHQCGTLAETARIFRKRGIRLDYLGVIPAVENYIPLFGYPRKAVINRKMPRHVRATEECARAIKARETRNVSTFHPFFAAVSRLFRWGQRLMWKWYKVSTDGQHACTGCGICAKVCPAGAITLEPPPLGGRQRPVWSARCEQCLACMSWCPAGAITFYGRSNAKSKNWVHPEIKLEDMLEGNL
jgi:ferredoxin